MSVVRIEISPNFVESFDEAADGCPVFPNVAHVLLDITVGVDGLESRASFLRVGAVLGPHTYGMDWWFATGNATRKPIPHAYRARIREAMNQVRAELWSDIQQRRNVIRTQTAAEHLS